MPFIIINHKIFTCVSIFKFIYFSGELDLTYKCATVEEIPDQFDLVVSSEVVEHVPCVRTFVSQCAKRVKVRELNLYVRQRVIRFMPSSHDRQSVNSKR